MYSTIISLYIYSTIHVHVQLIIALTVNKSILTFTPSLLLLSSTFLSRSDINLAMPPLLSAFNMHAVIPVIQCMVNTVAQPQLCHSTLCILSEVSCYQYRRSGNFRRPLQTSKIKPAKIYHTILLYLVLGLCVVESILTQKFNHLPIFTSSCLRR